MALFALFAFFVYVPYLRSGRRRRVALGHLRPVSTRPCLVCAHHRLQCTKRWQGSPHAPLMLLQSVHLNHTRAICTPHGGADGHAVRRAVGCCCTSGDARSDALAEVYTHAPLESLVRSPSPVSGALAMVTRHKRGVNKLQSPRAAVHVLARSSCTKPTRPDAVRGERFVPDQTNRVYKGRRPCRRQFRCRAQCPRPPGRRTGCSWRKVPPSQRGGSTAANRTPVSSSPGSAPRAPSSAPPHTP